MIFNMPSVNIDCEGSTFSERGGGIIDGIGDRGCRLGKVGIFLHRAIRRLSPPTWSMAGLDEPDNGVYSRGGGADLGKIVALNGY